MFDILDEGQEQEQPQTPDVDASSQDQESQASWYLDDDRPGDGDRPEWLPEKFKSVSDMAKSYESLEKKFGEAPNEYDFSKAENWLDPDFEGLDDLRDFAKSKRVPQDVLDKVFETVGSWLGSFQIDRNAEREALGDNAKERIEVLNNWASSNLSEEAYHALTGSLVTADSIKALEEVRKLMIDNGSTVPSGNDSATSNGPSLDDIENEMTNNWDKYKSDPSYRREIQAKLERAAQNSDAGLFHDKHGS